MIEECTKLDIDMHAKYTNRKETGKMSFLVDVDSEKIYPVPLNVEHVDFARRVLRENKSYERLVPADVYTNLFNPPKICRVVTGVSGLEIGHGVRHRIEDLKIAHGLIWRLINNGDFEVGELLENKIVERYVM